MLYGCLFLFVVFLVVVSFVLIVAVVVVAVALVLLLLRPHVTLVTSICSCRCRFRSLSPLLLLLLHLQQSFILVVGCNSYVDDAVVFVIISFNISCCCCSICTLVFKPHSNKNYQKKNLTFALPIRIPLYIIYNFGSGTFIL